MRLMDAASRASPCKGFGARHHNMRIAAEIEWRPGLPIATWVFAGRGGGGFGARSRIEWGLGFDRHDARRGSPATRLQDAGRGACSGEAGGGISKRMMSSTKGNVRRPRRHKASCRRMRAREKMAIGSLFGLSKSIGFEPPLISWPFLLFVFLFSPQRRAGGTKTIWRLTPPLAALANGPKSSLTVIPTAYDFDNDVLPRNGSYARSRAASIKRHNTI